MAHRANRIASPDSANEEPTYRLQRLNTLAFPKGQLPRCEMTGLPARVQCVTPQITLYYATKEFAEQAWHGIMHKIAPLLAPLRAPSLVVGTEEDRAKREYTMELSKKALVDVCSREAAKFLSSGHYELAVPGALQALGFLKDIYGDEAVETISPYLQLAEAYLGLGKHRPAEEFLRRANWSILKNPDCSNNLRSQLHRNFGKLYFAANKLGDALAELSHDVYCSSLDKGPEHIATSVGYFHLGSVFYAQHKIENALAFYDKVVDIWCKFLAAARTDADLAESASTSQLHEAADMLSHVLTTRVKLLGDTHIACGEAKYTIGLLHLFADQPAEARASIEEACAIYKDHLGLDHPSTKDIRDVLDRMPPLGGPDTIVAFDDDPAKGGSHVEEDGAAAGFDSIDAHFPRDMPRAAPQSPIPQVPEPTRL